MASGWGSGDEECSVIGDKGEIGFIDYEDDKSVCSYNMVDEGPVVISAPFPFIGRKPQSVLVGETAKDCVTINNTSSEPIDLWSVKIYCSNPEDSYSLSLMEPPSTNSTVEEIQGFMEAFTLEDRVLQPRRTLTVWVSCKPKDIGLHTSVVHFDVGNDRIERVIFLLAEDRISQSLVSNRPYQRAQRRNRQSVTDYVGGLRPSRSGTKFKNALPHYNIPKDIREKLESKEVPDVIAQGLNKENYGAFFSTLLIMEELKLEEEMKGHDMESVMMRKKGQFLALEVPGLAERRPSLVIGDHVFATADPADDGRPFQGFIHRVEADEVFLKFAKDFHLLHQDGNLYNIRFSYNRVNMRRLYQALQAAVKLDNELLFPSQTSERTIEGPPMVPITPYLNMEQMSSVEKILGCQGAPPYVIHGPPGTGKTLTLVEAILQLYKNRDDSRILVCASSNSAADHIIDNLISKEHVKIQDYEIFRLNALSRPYEDVRTEHIRFCYFEDYVFKCPPLKALMRYRIIISTYMSASQLSAEGIKRGHFSHIFLDEAGQSSEPETMIPISSLCRKETVVVLAGDPMQLGPVIYSKEAETYGLGKSYLERLFECEFYHNENENFVTKLIRNYRCHPAILELPSELFYKGELIAAKDEIPSAGAWKSLLPNKDFPVLFIGIQGCDEREGNNPSWFNRIEISKVVEIIKKLRNNDDLNDSDIGVITPYRQQVLKLRKILDEQLDMPDVKVGSVEQFQGQERQVIIISTVRSTVKHNEFDKIHYLGFLSNPRRFNVATTRARSLLVIIGNPHIIAKDPFWDKLLRYCADNNSYQGCSLPEAQEFTEEDFNVTQRVYYEHQKFQPNNGDWGESNNGDWGESNNGDWGENNNGGWGESNNGGWGNGQENIQPNDGRGYESFSAVEAAKPVTDDAGWVESNNGGWGSGHNNFQPTDATGWDDESFSAVEAAKPVTDDAGWVESNNGNWGSGHNNFQPIDATGWDDESFSAVEAAKPVTDDAGWVESNNGSWGSGHNNFQPTDATGWDDESFNAVEAAKPVTDDAGWVESNNRSWCNEHETVQPNNGSGWGDESFSAVETVKPVTNNAESSYGWKSNRARKAFQPNNKGRQGKNISNQDAVKTEVSTDWNAAQAAQDPKSFRPTYEVEWEFS